MRRLALCALLLLAPDLARADYSPLPANDLILASDTIVVGEIVGLDASTFTLRVEATVAGPVASSTIEVERFEDWICAARWAPYAVGQRALLFLESRGSGWRIRGAGGEGEMPIVNDAVHVRDVPELAPSGANAHARHTVHGGPLVGFTVGRAELVAALRRARACYEAELRPVRYRRVGRVRAVCAEAERDALSATPIGAVVRRVLSAH